jgi:hypothetical protein
MAYRNGQRTPTASPSKADDGLAGPAYDLKALGDDPMAWEHPVFEGTEPAAVAEVPDLRAEVRPTVVLSILMTASSRRAVPISSP